MLGMAIATCRGMRQSTKEGNMDKLMDTAEWMLAGLGISIVLYLASIFVAALIGA